MFQINSINSTESPLFTKKEVTYILILTILGAGLRIFFHYNRPFVGDEIWTWMYLKETPLYILSNFDQVGMQMPFFILLEKLLYKLSGYNQIILPFVPQIAGIAIIPLTALLAKRFTSKTVVYISTGLAALNAYLISYSGILRSYSLLTALSLAGILLFFNWDSKRTYKNGVYVALVFYLMLLSHLNGAYTLAYILFIAGIDFLNQMKNKEETKIQTLITPLVFLLLFVYLSYINVWPKLVKYRIPWHDTPPTSLDYIPYAFSLYFADGFYAWLSSGLIIIGILFTIKYDKPSILLLPNIVISILLISAQGITAFPWAMARWTIHLVPIYIIFLAEGIQYFISLFPQKVYRHGIVVLTILVIGTWIPNNLYKLYKEKNDAPWNEAALFIKNSPNVDLVLGNSFFDEFNLRPYFSDPQLPRLPMSGISEKIVTKTDGRFVLFISSIAINTNYPINTFGNIQIITYPSESYQDLLRIIRDDLLKSAQPKEVSPGLTDLYLNVWRISNLLDPGNIENFKYHDLYIQCNQLTSRQIYMQKPYLHFQLERGGYLVSP